MRLERAAELLRREDADVKAKAEPILSGGKAMLENPREVLLGDSDAVVGDRDDDGLVTVGMHADVDAPGTLGAVGESMHGVFVISSISISVTVCASVVTAGTSATSFSSLIP